MTRLVFLIEQFATGLYIVIAALFVYRAWHWQRARVYHRGASFELERDIARYTRLNHATVMVLLLEVVLVVLGVQLVVAPTVRRSTDTTQTLEQVAQDGVFESPTPFFGSDTQIDASGINLNEDLLNLQPLQTPTLTPTPVGTIQAAPPVDGCNTPDATLQIPANGMVVHEAVSVMGTANTADFAFYRFEINGESTGNNYALLQEYSQPVPNQSVLGQFVPSFYQPGTYLFRLVVFDVTNALRAECTITIYISAPIPTPTPIGQ